MSTSVPERQVIIKIFGGLGNQMFQYAFGRSLSHALNLPLKADITFQNNKQKSSNYRRYELSYFKLSLAIAKPNEIPLNKEPLIYKLLGFKIPKQPVTRIKENLLYRYDTELLSSLMKSTNSLYLDGYWQSYKYFDNIRQDLLNDFTPKGNLSKSQSELISLIKKSNSVAIHIRRGDYVSNPKANAHHGLCSVDYFKSAVDYITGKVSDAQFFIFSDDIDWCKGNLQIEGDVTYIIPDEVTPTVDLHMMSQCRHFIISNSSFSWWAAWLSVHADKIVIAPRDWLRNNVENCMDDLIPQTWIRM